MSKVLPDKFNFFVPATFTKSGETGQMKISGICSTIAEDSDQEILEPMGFDFKPLLEKGYYNWNHQANKSSGAILGRPTSAKVINGGKAFYTEGFLYKGVEESKRVFELAAALEEEDPDRQLGFSIEGQAIERDAINPKRIKKARITGIAITHCPKNPNTLLSIMKGEYQEPFIEDDEKKCEKCGKVESKCECAEKSMSTGNVPMPESVEGKPKKQVEDDVILTKSEVFNKIFEKYTTEIEKSNQIYTFIHSVSNKLFKMENIITEDTLKKAFELLDASIVKGEEGTGEQKKPGDYDKKDEILKAEEEAAKKKKEEEEAAAKKKAEEEGTTETTTVMEKSEVTETTTEAPKEEVKKSVEFQALETLTERIEKSFGSQETFYKSLTDSLDNKFGALGTILKSQAEREEQLIKQNDDLKKSFETLQGEVDKIGKEGVPAKSARNVRAVDKFQKAGEEGNIGGVNGVDVYELNKSEDRRALSTRLFEKATELKNAGRDYSVIEKNIQSLEITKSLSTDIKPLLREMKIDVTTESIQG